MARKYGSTIKRTSSGAIRATKPKTVMPYYWLIDKKRDRRLSSNFKANGSITQASRGSVWFDAVGLSEYTYTDSARFDFPDGDWFVASLIHVKVLSGTRYIFSVGAQGGPQNLQLYLNGAVITAQYRTVSGSTDIPVAGASLTAGWWVVGVQRSGTNLQIFTCPLGGSATFGTNVGITTNTGGLTPSGTHSAGARSTSKTNTYWQNNIAYIAKGNGTLSGTEIANLAAGQDILTDLGKTLTVYTRFDEALSSIPNSVSGNTDPATRVNNPLTRGGPPLSGLAIRIDRDTIDEWGRVWQRNGTSRNMTFAGDYLGNPKKGLQARIVGTGNAVVVPWKDCKATGVGRWQVTLNVPQSLSDNVLEVRFKDDTTKYGRMFYPFGVGMVLLGTGQSNMNNMATSGLRALNVSQHCLYSGGVFRDLRINNLGAGFSELLFHLQANIGASIPIMMLNVSVSGSSLTATPNGWNDLGGTVWAGVISGLAACGGDAEAILWHHGEADASNGIAEATYASAMLTLINNLRTQVGRTAANLPFFTWILGQAGTVQAQTTWRFQRNAHLSTIANGTNVRTLGPAFVLDLVDALHYVTTQNGYMDLGCFNAQALLNYYNPATYTTGMDGPFITGATRSGNDVIVTFNLNGNASLFIPTASPAVIDALEVRDGGGILQTVNSWSVTGNQLTLTIATTPAAGWTLDYVYRDVLRPNGTGNYALADNDNMLYGSNTIVGTSRRVPARPMTAPITLT